MEFSSRLPPVALRHRTVVEFDAGAHRRLGIKHRFRMARGAGAEVATLGQGEKATRAS